jgi:hypothetical protein
MDHNRKQTINVASSSFTGGLKNFTRSLDVHRSHVSEKWVCTEPGNSTDKRKD